MIIEINDMNTPMLLAMKAVSRDVAYEHMSKIGNTVRKNAVKRMQMSKHNWHQKPRSKSNITKKVNGKTVYKKGGKTQYLTPYYDSSKTKELGMRTNKSGEVDTPSSMGNMISSFLMEKSGTLIIGGRNKAFTPVERKDGEIVGVEKRQKTITKHTQSIIHKLDTGERNKYHGWGSTGSDKKSMKGFNGASYKGRHFMMKGFGDSMSYMKQELTSGYEKTIGRAVNKVSIKLKPSKRKVV